MVKYCDTSMVAPVYATPLSVPVMVTGIAALFVIVTVPVIVPVAVSYP